MKNNGRKIFKEKNLQYNYFRAEIGQKEQQLLRRKVKKDGFLIIGEICFFF